jgi:nitroreductase
MEFSDVVGARRTIRDFQPDRPVEKDKIRRILEAARLQSQHLNAQLVRKAIVVTQNETPAAIRNGLIDALYGQPQAVRAPVAIVWVQDMAGWKPIVENLLQQQNNLPGLPTENIIVHANARPEFTEWLTSFECGLAVGAALLAAVDEGLGTGLISGRREEIRKLFAMPETCTPTQVQLLGYAAEDGGAGGARFRPEFNELYFADTWGKPL